jgi:hypothetical protein
MTLQEPQSVADNCHYDDGIYRAGDVVLADVRNPIENCNSKGKVRPFLLVGRTDGHWRGMGLTTRSHYVTGAPRVAIPDPEAAGLRGPGFLWGDRLTNVSALDIHRVIGRVTSPLAEAVIDLASLSDVDSEALREAAHDWALDE